MNQLWHSRHTAIVRVTGHWRSKNFERVGRRKTIYQLRPHLSQMRTTKYMPFTRKKALFEKNISQWGRPLNPPLLLATIFLGVHNKYRILVSTGWCEGLSDRCLRRGGTCFMATAPCNFDRCALRNCKTYSLQSWQNVWKNVNGSSHRRLPTFCNYSVGQNIIFIIKQHDGYWQ